VSDKLPDEPYCHEMEEIEKLMRDYVALVGSDTTLAATYYEEPASVVGPKAFLLMQTKAEVIQFLIF
jgi:hypothetical protein